MTRRQFWTHAAGALPVFAAKDAAAPGLNAQQALDRLMEGNRRFREAHPLHPDEEPARRFSLSQGQHPFATVLTCADSRVPPEVIFDQGLGDLFVIRVAGNIADDAVLGSIEYAAVHLSVPLVLVLGHERCGAVSAAVEAGHPSGHVQSLVRAIRPAVEHARSMPGDLIDNAVRANVTRVASQIRGSKPLLAPLVEQRKLTVAGARYDLDSGEVEILS